MGFFAAVLQLVNHLASLHSVKVVHLLITSLFWLTFPFIEICTLIKSLSGLINPTLEICDWTKLTSHCWLINPRNTMHEKSKQLYFKQFFWNETKKIWIDLMLIKTKLWLTIFLELSLLSFHQISVSWFQAFYTTKQFIKLLNDYVTRLLSKQCNFVLRSKFNKCWFQA